MASFLKRSRQKEELPETATGVKQTIQARHGTATFVPKGFTIKIINTYGRQVVDTWAFALHAPPTQEEWNEDNKDTNDIEEEDEQSDEAVEKGKNEDAAKSSKNEAGGLEKAKSPEDSQTVVVERQPESPKEEAGNVDGQQKKEEENSQDSGKPDSKQDAKEGTTSEEGGGAKQEDAEKGKEEAQSLEEKGTDNKKPEEKTNEQGASEGQGKGWSSYLPSIRGRGKQVTTVDTKAQEDEPKSEPKNEEKGSPTASKGWASYIPSVRRGKQNPNEGSKSKEQRTWASYIPSGQGFSSYIKNNDAISSFASLHQRDPTKSVAEQLYEFSKTPVGAAGISVASGSGYASTLYAAYTAYSTVATKRADQNQPGMEFLSMSHSRVSTMHLSPEVGDVLVTNLRAPLLTLIEDQSPGGHDTLIPACDPIRYRELGVKNWAEHGSCAENLVLALQELNKQTGLKGRKAIGSDVTVNSAPAPLNLFMNVSSNEQGQLSFSSPQGQRGNFVKFRAERDVVVVMSACPQDVTSIYGGKPMVAHFVVESASEEDRRIADQRAREAQAIIDKARRRTESEGQTRMQSFRQSSSKSTGRPSSVRQSSGQRAAPRKLERRASSRSESIASVPRKESQRIESPPPPPPPPPPRPQPSTTPSATPSATPGRNKPRKLERRTSTPRPPPRRQ